MEYLPALLEMGFVLLLLYLAVRGALWVLNFRLFWKVTAAGAVIVTTVDVSWGAGVVALILIGLIYALLQYLKTRV